MTSLTRTYPICVFSFFFFNDTATTEIYTLSLHDALPIFFRATIRLMGQRIEDSPQVKQMVEKVTGLYEQFIKLSQSLNYDTMIAAARGDDPSRLSDTIAANLQLPVDEKQEIGRAHV